MARSNSGGTLVNAAVLATDKCSLKRVSCDNTNVAAGFLQVFNSNVLPTNGTVPEFERAVGVAASVELDLGQAGERFNKGVAVAFSSTSGVLTLGGANTFFQATYY